MKKIAAILATVMVAGTLMVACGSEEAVALIIGSSRYQRLGKFTVPFRINVVRHL